MSSLATIHITIDRHLWDDGVEDATLGRVLREATEDGLDKVRARAYPLRPDLGTVEITLADEGYAYTTET